MFLELGELDKCLGFIVLIELVDIRELNFIEVVVWKEENLSRI